MSIEEIVWKLEEASKAYYSTGETLMSDWEFDALKEKLEELDPNNSFLDKVGALGIPDREKVDVGFRMFSTDKSLSVEELRPFINRVVGATEFVESQKVDGMAINLLYKDGELIQAATRGNGQIGRVVTQKMLLVDKSEVPNKLSQPFNGKIRGEVFLTYSHFEKLNEILRKGGEEEQDNCRNSAAGLINAPLENMLNSKEKLALLSFRAYGVYDESDDSTDVFGSYKNYEDQLKKACDLGFKPVQHRIIKKMSEFTDFVEERKEWLEKFDFPNDGIVFRVNDQQFARSLGSARNYLNAVTAFKFKPEMVLAEVIGITWQQGSVEFTPRIQIEPVELSGATISWVGGHSVKNLVDLEAYPGNMIALVRSGGVIPRGYHRRVYDEL